MLRRHTQFLHNTRLKRLRVAKQHERRIHVIQLTVDARETSRHTALENHHRPGAVHFKDRHAGRKGCRLRPAARSYGPACGLPPPSYSRAELAICNPKLKSDQLQSWYTVKISKIASSNRITKFQRASADHEVAERKIDPLSRLLASDPGDDLSCDCC